MATVDDQAHVLYVTDEHGLCVVRCAHQACQFYERADPTMAVRDALDVAVEIHDAPAPPDDDVAVTDSAEG